MVLPEPADYTALDAAMTARGYATTLLSGPMNVPVRLPQGSYLRAEPTNEEIMRDDALAALLEIGAGHSGILATSGLSAWTGLEPVD